MTDEGKGSALPATGWGWILAYGIIVLLVGFVAFFNPVATGLATGLILGLSLIIFGVFAIIAGVSYLSGRARFIELLLGVLGVVAGAIVIFNPFAGALSLVFLIGAWLLVIGIFEVISAFQVAHDRGWRLALGVMDIVLGGLLLFSSPVTGLAFLAFCVGFSFLVRGIFLVILALRLRRLERG